MKPARVPLALLAFAVSGCTLPPPQDFIGYLSLHSAGAPHGDQLQVTASGLISPDVNLSREPGAFRGWAKGSEVELRIEGDVIKGSRGSMPVELHVSREGNALVARGLYGGRLTDLAVCVPPSADAAAPRVTSLQGPRPCIADNAVTVARMVATLGDAPAMAMLVTAYFR
jgi:hypothetical protein